MVQGLLQYDSVVGALLRLLQENGGSDEELVAALDGTMDKRTQELVAEVLRSPDKFYPCDRSRVQSWAAAGAYVPPPED